MRSRLVIPSAETLSSPILAPKLRGKLAKEVYRCGKGMLVSGSLAWDLYDMFIGLQNQKNLKQSLDLFII